MIRAYQAAHGGLVFETQRRRRQARSSRLLAAATVLGMALAVGTVQHFAAAQLDAGRTAPAAWSDTK
ncbi:hypothetical protein G5B46_11340 [Caulobacter sp. 602-2]|uniref:Uncharacterized protein n=1 Tax=Caulobacter sp. 602-2 TaxID=2710887 RepID=A0A6G4QXE1_9CAUL|nr:hypothetical protein [Caulobacter sp. 602-2]NGM50202.1 hypothetical protein [Caulobacter sp. 602-2]